MTWGGHETWVTELDPWTGRVCCSPKCQKGAGVCSVTEFSSHPAGVHTRILQWDDQSQPNNGFFGDGCGTRYMEGPSLYKHGNFFFALSSWGSMMTDYTIRVCRSTSPRGPFRDKTGQDCALRGGGDFGAYGSSMLLGAEGEQSVPGHPHLWEEEGVTYMGYDFRKGVPARVVGGDDLGEAGMDYIGVRRVHWVADSKGGGAWPTIWQPLEVELSEEDARPFVGQALGVALWNSGEAGSVAAFDMVTLEKSGSGSDSLEARSGFDWGSGCASGSGCFTMDLPVKDQVEEVGVIPAGKYDVFVRLEAVGDIDIQLYDVEYRGDNNQWPEGEGQAIVAWCSMAGCNGLGTIGMQASKGAATYDRGGAIEPMTIEYTGYNGQNGNLGDEYIRITGVTSTTLLMKVFAYATGSARVTYSWGEGRSDCCRGLVPCIGTPFTQPVAKNGILTVGEIPSGKKDISIRLATPDGSDVDVQLYDITETDPFDEGKAIIAWCAAPSTCNYGVLNGPGPASVFYPNANGPEYFWTGYNGQNGNLGDESIRITGTTDRPLVMKVFGYAAGEATVTYSWWEV